MAKLKNSMPDVLSNIIAHKKIEVSLLKESQPLSSFIKNVTLNDLDFFKALNKKGPRFILECKKASPSKGLIRADFNLEELARVYSKYADCISVLTDEKFFKGNYEYLGSMRKLSDKPLLHKDFIIDSYQIYLGRFYGANAVLLMLSVLDDSQYEALAFTATSLNMTILTEVSNEEEARRAVKLNAKLIGINNRNLRDLSTKLDTTFALSKLIPNDRLIISESGIYTNQEVRHLSQVAGGFLVGSSLMMQENLEDATRKLVLGEHKVCGLTNQNDAKAAYEAGAYYGGFIFYPPSPRYIAPEQAKEISKVSHLKHVGVFVNDTIEHVSHIANELKLSAVQLHGNEDDAYIQKLRASISPDCQIWKAYSIKDSLPSFTQLADKLLLDTYHQTLHGGSGERFNWQLLDNEILKCPVILAGGLNNENCLQAAKQPVLALDFNSGLESEPGIKSTQKIQSTFLTLREFSYE